MCHKKYNILVTGCGGDIGQSIGKVLKSHELFGKVIGCDMSDEHAGRFIFDEVARVPPCSASGYFEELYRIICLHSIDILLPVSEPELRLVAACPADFVLHGTTLIAANKKAMDIGFDKLATIDFLRKTSLPFPDTDIIAEVTSPRLPAIAKSRQGAGGKLVFVIDDIEDFYFFKRKYPAFIIQELLQNGDEEYTCGLFRSSSAEVRTLIYNRKLVDSYSAYGEAVDIEVIHDLLRKIADGLDLRGSINVQLRMANKGPCVFEINPRFSSTVRFRHMMGFSDVIWSIQDALGIPIDDYKKVEPGVKFYKGFTEYVN